MAPNQKNIPSQWVYPLPQRISQDHWLKHEFRQYNVEMNKPLTQDDFVEMENQLKDSVEKDKQYWRVNDVKCDAIYTAKSYEEFADRVAAAHLRPLDKSDYKKKSNHGWNQYAPQAKDRD